MLDAVVHFVLDAAASVNLLTAVPLSLASAFVAAWKGGSGGRCRFCPSVLWLTVLLVGWLAFFSLLQPFARQVRYYDNEREEQERDYQGSCKQYTPGTAPLKPACIKARLNVQESSYERAWADVTTAILEWVEKQLSSVYNIIFLALCLICVFLGLVVYAFIAMQRSYSVGTLQRERRALVKLGLMQTHGPTPSQTDI
jgi:hypothetical protein